LVTVEIEFGRHPNTLTELRQSNFGISRLDHAVIKQGNLVKL
jgi:hypothetical protein